MRSMHRAIVAATVLSAVLIPSLNVAAVADTSDQLFGTVSLDITDGEGRPFVGSVALYVELPPDGSKAALTDIKVTDRDTGHVDFQVLSILQTLKDRLEQDYLVTNLPTHSPILPTNG